MGGAWATVRGVSLGVKPRLGNIIESLGTLLSRVLDSLLPLIWYFSFSQAWNSGEVIIKQRGTEARPGPFLDLAQVQRSQREMESGRDRSQEAI